MSDLLKYVGMDDHQSTLVIIVLNAIGQFEMQAIIKTETEAVREFFRKLAGIVHLIFEAGTQSAWLYELINPLVSEVVVCEMRKHKSRGNHADATDAEQLAQLLRLGNVTSVSKGDRQQRQLKELARNDENLISDATRASNRLKSLDRARGINCDGREIYKPSQREKWLAKLPEEAARFRAQSLLEQRETIQKLRKAARVEWIKQAQNHPDSRLLLTVPGIGPLRVAHWIKRLADTDDATRPLPGLR